MLEFEGDDLVERIRRCAPEVRRAGGGGADASVDNSVRAFTEAVLESRGGRALRGRFVDVLRVYANILSRQRMPEGAADRRDEPENKPTLRRLLESMRGEVGGLDGKTAGRIYRDARPGRYVCLARSVQTDSDIPQGHADLVLDAIDGAYRGEYERVTRSCAGIHSARGGGPEWVAVLTGVMEALRPDTFAVCNNRMRELQKWTSARSIRRALRRTYLDGYADFNGTCRKLVRRAGLRDMRELDRIAGRLYRGD